MRELAAWIESNILLQLASAPFDKQDETLFPKQVRAPTVPKRTGFNKLLFPDVRKDSCTSPDCFRAKIDAYVKKTLETKPQLVQISAAWNSREGAPLGTESVRGVRDQEAQGERRKHQALSRFRNPVTRWLRLSSWTAVSADSRQGLCRSSLPGPPSQHAFSAAHRAGEGRGAEANRERETGHNDSPSFLATILQRVSAPLKKADLLTVADYLIGHLSYSQVPALAKRHRVEAKKTLRPRRSFWPSKSANMTSPNSASCFWKSACWIRLINVPPPAATTFSWTPPNATEWIPRSCKRS